jgi:hypothetical protein
MTRHADVDVTLGIYAHIDIDALRGALDSIECEEMCAVVATFSQIEILIRPVLPGRGGGI